MPFFTLTVSLALGLSLYGLSSSKCTYPCSVDVTGRVLCDWSVWRDLFMTSLCVAKHMSRLCVTKHMSRLCVAKHMSRLA